MEKQLVTIVRKWHEPFIRMDVTEVGIGVTMSLEDFVEALAKEMKVDTNGLKAAGERVIAAVKRETTTLMQK